MEARCSCSSILLIATYQRLRQKYVCNFAYPVNALCVAAAVTEHYPVPALSDDVQRPISDQRSLRHGACAEEPQSAAAATTRAS